LIEVKISLQKQTQRHKARADGREELSVCVYSKSQYPDQNWEIGRGRAVGASSSCQPPWLPGEATRSADSKHRGTTPAPASFHARSERTTSVRQRKKFGI